MKQQHKGQRGHRGHGGHESNPSSLSFPSPLSSLLRVHPSILFLTFSLVIGLAACGGQHRTSNQSPAENKSPQDADSKLTFFDVTLEQADEVGRPIWKVIAKQAKYTKEKKLVRLKIHMVSYTKMAKLSTKYKQKKQILNRMVSNYF